MQSAVYIPGSETNIKIRNSENINASWKYRKYLQENATSIMKYNQLLNCSDYNCDYNYTNNQISPNTPFLYNSCLDNRHQFGYENSNMKQQFLSKQQLECRKVAPEIRYK